MIPTQSPQHLQTETQQITDSPSRANIRLGKILHHLSQAPGQSSIQPRTGSFRQSPQTDQNHLKKLKVATFDSGFGGFLTAKEIEKKSIELVREYDVAFDITHFGDTDKAPYGNRSNEEIGRLTTQGVQKALNQGAKLVFIACNTASTQYNTVLQNLPNQAHRVISIIDGTVDRLKDIFDEKLQNKDVINVAILATPATTKNSAYPHELTRRYGGKMVLEQTPVQDKNGNLFQMHTIKFANKTINLYQMAPERWVGLIEGGADIIHKDKAVREDMQFLNQHVPSGVKFDAVGEFCTHYPVFENNIKLQSKMHERTFSDTHFVKQGEIMADIFEARIKPMLESVKRPQPLSHEEAKGLVNDTMKAKIIISGDNVTATQRLVQAIFHESAEIRKEPFSNQLDLGSGQMEQQAMVSKL